MTIEPKTTQDVNDLILAQIETELNVSAALLPKAFMRVLAKALAGVFVLLYKYCGFMFLQIFVESASNDVTEINGKQVKPLTFWGNLSGVGPPTAAVAAELDIEFNAILPTGASVLPSGTPLLSETNGVTYVTTGAVAYGGATPNPVTATMVAAGDQSGGNGSGAIGNLADSDTLDFVSPPANIERTATVQATNIDGVDEEDIDVYRNRILARFQTPPQGGAYADYAIWAETVNNVVNAYPYTGDPGQVDVYTEVSTSIDADGIPPAGYLTTVYNAIQLLDSGLASRRPVGAYVNSLPISRTTFNVEVENLIVDNPTTAQASITTALQEWFLDREPYIPGWSVGVRKDQIFEAAVAGVVNDVVSSLGGIFTGVALTESAVPFSVRILGEGEKCKATVTFS